MLRKPIFTNFSQYLPNVGVIAAKCTQAWDSKDFWHWKAMIQNIYITAWGEMVLTKPLCLIHWESERAGKATVMSVTALIVCATKNVAYCLLLNTNWLEHFLFCCLCRKWWKGSLSVVSVAFLFSPPLFSSLSCYLSALTPTFCFFPWPLKTADQF